MSELTEDVGDAGGADESDEGFLLNISHLRSTMIHVEMGSTRMIVEWNGNRER